MIAINESKIYYVDESGSVYSMYKKGGAGKLQATPSKINTSKSSNGYSIVHLYENGKRKTVQVHRLIALAFIPNPLGKKEVNHKDGNKLNNKVENLEWVTPSENLSHAVKNGLKRAPPRKAMLTDEQVLTIRTMNNFKFDSILASKYGIGKSSICNVRLRKTYKNIP